MYVFTYVHIARILATMQYCWEICVYIVTLGIRHFHISAVTKLNPGLGPGISIEIKN